MADSEHHDTPGEPPEIRDEAADSPMWLPALGLTLLLIGALFIIWRGASGDDAAGEEAAAAEEAAPAAVAEPEADAEDDADAPE